MDNFLCFEMNNLELICLIENARNRATSQATETEANKNQMFILYKSFREANYFNLLIV